MKTSTDQRTDRSLTEPITQTQAAERLGVAPPRISEIARNKVDKLSLDYRVRLCAKASVSAE